MLIRWHKDIVNNKYRCTECGAGLSADDKSIMFAWGKGYCNKCGKEVCVKGDKT